MESRAQTLETASALREVFGNAAVPLIFKSSFDKANRSSKQSFRGVGLDEGLSILSEVRDTIGLPVLTDVHDVGQVSLVAQVVDVIQIPAFLCRQTDLVAAAATTGKAVNIKKGQFMAPWDMPFILEKATSAGNDRIMVCERGTCFGYNNLVVDIRSLEILKRSGHPVIFDATHSVQLPGAGNGVSLGQREFVSTLAKAAVTVGIAGLFMETHPDPDNALCDGPNMLPIKELPPLLSQLVKLDAVVKGAAIPKVF
jgi:2-dehydro-3-deoxyphosphooctonate aldolase (KDO 8-P synthase)